jgi:hypothetical protein
LRLLATPNRGGKHVTSGGSNILASWVKTHYNEFFCKSQWQIFLGKSNIVALYSNIFEKLGKNEDEKLKPTF